MTLETTPGQRVAGIYKGIIVPIVEPTSIGNDGLPHTPEGILHTVEKHWLGGEGAMLIQRHITSEGSLQLERLNLNAVVNARTVDGAPCPIVWGVSIEGKREEDDIVEPHLLVPEGREVVINLSTPSFSRRIAVLGVYDQESSQPGMPPTRTPLLDKDGRAGMYVGNQLVFWKDRDWGYLRVITPVKSQGGDLTTIEEGAPEVALHGGLYIIVVPEKLNATRLDIDSLLGNSRKNGGFGGDSLRYGDGFLGASRGVTMGGDSKGLLSGRVGGLTQGEKRATGGLTEFEAEVSDIVPFILRVRATGEMPTYLTAAGAAVDNQQNIHVKGAICAHCGVNAPRGSYTWKGNEFHFDEFNCGRCGGGSLEPVQYKKRVQKQ